MADQGQRTEQPTERRIEKARKEGQFPASREFALGVEFAVFVALLVAFAPRWIEGSRRMMRSLLALGFHASLTEAELMRVFSELRDGVFLPLLAGIAACKGASVAAHLGVTGLGFSLAKLGPNWSRLNPLERFKNLPRENLPQAIQAAILLPVFGFLVWGLIGQHLPMLVTLPKIGLAGGLALVGESMKALLGKAVAVFLLLGAVDLYRQKRRYTKSLRMTKQDVREEMKEVEGNPQMRMRIRRLRRDLLRRQMMREVPKATAVVVNPTHFAIAIKYEVDSMAAPKVVAKGKNYLAARIRRLAVENQVPIVENPPLAQALYKSVEVGQEIPAHLYRAVAEVLAYIFRLMNRRR
jgi:flagellar biosynthetic protein FlhB